MTNTRFTYFEIIQTVKGFLKRDFSLVDNDKLISMPMEENISLDE